MTVIIHKYQINKINIQYKIKLNGINLCRRCFLFCAYIIIKLTNYAENKDEKNNKNTNQTN